MSDKTRIQSNNSKLQDIDETLGNAANVFQSLPNVNNTNATSTDIVSGKTAITRSGITAGQLDASGNYGITLSAMNIFQLQTKLP